MTRVKTTMSPLALAACVAMCAWAHAALASTQNHRHTSTADRSPLSSRDLWATINVCNPHDQPNTIGIRGSMPGDGNAKDTLYMRFEVQYLDLASKSWKYAGQRADSGFVKIGSAAVARQGGHSFEFARVAGKPSFELRGVVTFEWRHGSKVLLHALRTTSAHRVSSAGADPKNYSAATCTLP